jgi:hypothetical protein
MKEVFSVFITGTKSSAPHEQMPLTKHVAGEVVRGVTRAKLASEQQRMQTAPALTRLELDCPIQALCLMRMLACSHAPDSCARSEESTCIVVEWRNEQVPHRP